MADNFRFGSQPHRSLETFGVAGVLDDSAQIYCETLFNTAQVGRVSDLITAQLRSLGVSELRLRALLLFAMFEGYETQRAGRTSTTGANGMFSLEEPLVVECGCDGEKVAVGISFTFPAEMTGSIDGLVERVKAGELQGAFDGILAELYRNSDSVLIRVQKSIRRLEIISFLAQPGKIAAESIVSDLAMIVVDHQANREPPAAIYCELADLDYTRLLADEGKGRMPDAPASGLILQQSFSELEEALRQRASGKTPPMLEENPVARIQGDGASASDDSVTVVKGGAEAESEKDVVIVSLKRRIAELEARPAPAPTPAPTEASVTVEGDAATEDDETVAELAGKTLRGLFGKFGRGKSPAEPEAEEQVAVVKATGEEEEKITRIKGEAQAPTEEKVTVIKGAPTVSDEDVLALTDVSGLPDIPEPPVSEDDVSGNFLVELQEGSFERMISRAQKESDDVRKEISSARAKRWVDGLMTEMMEEKARLQEFAKKVNQTVKQREFDFKKREIAYDEAIKKRDSLLRQKNAALSRAKDQVSMLSQNIDKLKAGPGAGREDSHAKQKLEMANRLVGVHKDQNIQLQKRVDDLTEKLAGLQSGLKARGSAETNELREKSDRLSRQVDELRRANQGLQEKLTDATVRPGKGVPASPATAEELRRKLEAAMKVAAQHQRDAEMKQLRVEELERESDRLQKELTDALARLKDDAA